MATHKLCFIFAFLVLALNTCSAEDDADPCSQLTKIKSFKTQFSFYNGAERVNGEELVTEVDSTLQLGKLSVRVKDDVLQVFYSNKEGRIISYSEQTQSCHEATFSQDLVYLGGMGDVGFVDKRGDTLYVGPSALWKHVLDHATAFRKADEDIVVRGMNAIKCTASFDQLYVFRDVVLNVYLSDSSWTGSDQVPVQFELTGRVDEANRFFVVDYFTFERVNADERFVDRIKLNPLLESDLVWRLPNVGCPALLREQQMPPLTQFELISFSVEKLDLQTIEQWRVALDLKNSLVRLDRHSEDVFDVIDLASRITCKVSFSESKAMYNSKEMMDQQFAHVPFLHLLLTNARHEYAYVGQEVVNGLLCDLYEMARTEGDKLVVMTVYMSMNTNLKADKQPNPTLARVTLHTLQRSAEAWKSRRETVFNIFDFMPFSYERDYAMWFDTRSCFGEDSDMQKVDLYALVVGENGEKYSPTRLRAKESTLKRSMIEHLQQMTGAKYLQFTDLDLDYGKEALHVELTLRNVDRPELYFARLDNFASAHERSPFSMDLLDTLENCFEKSWKDAQVLGFTYCPKQQCHQLLDASLLHASGSTSGETTCVTYRKLSVEPVDVKTVHELVALLRNEIIGPGNCRFTLPDNTQVRIFKVSKHFDHDQALLEQPYQLVADHRRLADAIVQKSFTGTSKTKLRNMGDCFSECRRNQDEDFDCNSFTFCDFGLFDVQCLLSDLGSAQLLADPQSLPEDRRCATFEFTYLSHFSLLEATKLALEPVRKVEHGTAEECAQQCMLLSEVPCFSMAFCDAAENEQNGHVSGSCLLYSKHRLHRAVKREKNESCDLYSLNFLNDFHKIKFDESTRLQFKKQSSMEGCAALCSMNADCKQLSFCPIEGDDFRLGICRTDQIDAPKDREQEELHRLIASVEKDVLPLNQCIMLRKKEHPPLVFDIESGYKKSKVVTQVLAADGGEEDSPLGPWLYGLMCLSSFGLTLFVNWLMERTKMHQAQSGISVKFERQENIEL